MNIDEVLDSHDALGLAGLIRRDEVTPSEVLDAVLARIEIRNPGINAVVDVWEDRARDTIRARGATGAGVQHDDGQFAGVPFLLKDLHTDVAGQRTTHGSRFFAEHFATETSEIVTRFERAGLVLAGKTNTPEFGLSPSTEPELFGPTRNPWNREHSAGGSSGGAAAAVAAGMVPVAHATDGGGSIRIPASANGLFGLKPSRGRTPFSGWLSVGHVVGRTVRDSAAMLDAIAGNDWVDRHAQQPFPGGFLGHVGTTPGRLRIGMTTQVRADVDVDAVCVAAVEDAATLLETLGHEIDEVTVPINWDQVAMVQGTTMGANTAADVSARARELGREPAADELEPLARLQYDRTSSQSITDYVDAQNALLSLTRDLDEFYATVDVVLTPTLTMPPPPLGTMGGAMGDIEEWGALMGAYTSFLGISNMTGQPAMSVPLHWHDGLPVGVQFVGRFGTESRLLQLAAQLEQARPWWHRRPPPWW